MVCNTLLVATLSACATRGSAPPRIERQRATRLLQTSLVFSDVGWQPELQSVLDRLQQIALADGHVSVARTTNGKIYVQVDLDAVRATEGQAFSEAGVQLFDALAGILRDHPSIRAVLFATGPGSRQSRIVTAPSAGAARQAYGYLSTHGPGVNRVSLGSAPWYDIALPYSENAAEPPVPASLVLLFSANATVGARLSDETDLR